MLARPASYYRHIRTYSSKAKRSGSGSSNSSEYSLRPHRSDSASNLLMMNILPASKWQRLKYLSLADNSLTSISAQSLAPVSGTLRSLNLASNLFTEIPDGLACLTRLASLDLSNCMIDSLRSLSRSPLPAITTLKLQSNRLQTLAGAEKLLSLENLNVQENKLIDPMEVARLTSLPNFRRMWVKHNPFTKLYSGYRVIIFNLFRNTPGYIDDVMIDDRFPNYKERTQLAERVTDVERRASPSAIRIVEAPVILQEPHPDKTIRGVSTEVSESTSRRKKTPRRRIVDLAHDDAPQHSHSGVAHFPKTSVDETRPKRSS